MGHGKREVLFGYRRSGKPVIQIYRDGVGLLTISQKASDFSSWSLPKFDSWEDLRKFLLAALKCVDEVIENAHGKDNESGLHFTIA